MSLTASERIKSLAGVPFFFSVKGETLTTIESSFITETKPSGIIYFKRNISSLSQLKELTSQINKSHSTALSRH
ncbi:hypothetical protein KAH37_05515 [bacterium]|nr:hypothetical protein [bacterium]